MVASDAGGLDSRLDEICLDRGAWHDRARDCAARHVSGPGDRRLDACRSNSVVGSDIDGDPPIRPGATLLARIAAALLAVGIVLGVVGLFPTYIDGASLASQPSNLVPHLIYLAAWAVSAVLILLGGMRRQAGALLGLGVSAVTFGLFFADAGTPLAGGAHLMGGGLILGILGWLACTAGAGTAFPASGLSLRRRARDDRARGRPAGLSNHDDRPDRRDHSRRHRRCDRFRAVLGSL